MALTMSAKQKLSNLALGVLLSSIVWDGIYLIVGRTVGSVLPKTQYMLLYSLGGLTVLYVSTLAVRYLLRSRYRRKKLAQ
jgi:membrane protein DedA with SNARE-associated domain